MEGDGVAVQDTVKFAARKISQRYQIFFLFLHRVKILNPLSKMY